MSFRRPVRRPADVRRRMFLEPLELRQLMAIDLDVALRVTDATQTIAQPGVDIAQIDLNGQYQIRGTVTDLRAASANSGVTQAYFDVNYNAGAGTAAAATIGADFPTGLETGTATATSVDQVGGGGGTNVTTNPQALFLLPFTANVAGVYTFTPELTGDQTNFPTLLGGNDPVDATELQAAGDTLTVLPLTDVIADPAAVDEDSAATNVALTGIAGGVGTTIAVTADAADPTLVDLAVTYTSGDATGTLVVTPKPNAFGTTQVNVHTTVNGAVRTRTFTFTVNAVVDSAEIQVPPGGNQVTFNEGAAPLVIAPAATVVDPDQPANFDGGSLSAAITGNPGVADSLTVQNQGTGAGQIGVAAGNVTYEGTIIGTFNQTPISFVADFNANATPTAVQALVRAITFEAPGANPSPLTRTVTLTMDDGTAAAATNTTIDVLVVANNDPPVINVTGPANYTEGAAAVVLDAAATITDADSADFDQGSLEVTVTVGNQPEDLLSIQNQGTGAGQIGVNIADVSYEGVVIGTYGGGDGANPLLVVFNAAATPTAVQALARAITFFNSSGAPNAAKTIQFEVTDGDGGLDNDTLEVAVTAVNTAPTITTANAVAYTEGAAAVVVDPTATVVDPDSADFNTGSLTVTVSVGNDATDVLEINNEGTAAGQIGVNGADVTYEGNVIGTFTGGNGVTPLVITFTTANATPAAVQQLVRNITFRSTSNAPPALKTVQFVVTDGDNGADQDETDVNITAVNNAPVLTFPGAPATYTEDAAAAPLDATATMVDADSTTFTSLTVEVTTAPEPEDLLAIQNVGTGAGQIGVNGANVTYEGVAIGTFTGGVGAPLGITLNAAATPAAVEALLRAITYQSASDDPLTTKVVTFSLTDGGAATGTETLALNVTPINDNPLLTTLPVTDAVFAENGPAVPVAPQSTVVDPDSSFIAGSLTVTITTAGEATDVLSVLNQGTAAGEIGVNGTDISFGGTVFATFTGGTNNAPLVITFNNAASAAAVQALVRRIAFDNTAANPSVLTRTVTFDLLDGDGGNTAATGDVQVTAANDPPVITLLPAAATAFTEGLGAVQIAPNSTVVDLDSADFDTGSLIVAITANGETADQLSVRNQGTGAGQIGFDGTTVTFEGTTIGTATGNNSGTLTITLNAAATPAAVEALTRNITFNNTSVNPGTATRTITFTVSDGDGANGTDNDTHDVAVVAVNDAPVVTLSNEGVAITAAQASRRISAAPTVTDVDSADFDTGTLTVAVIANGTADDRLEFAAPVVINGADVVVGGVTIGTFTGGVGANDLVITFNANATPARVQTLIGNIVYRHANPTVAEPTRTIEFVLTDGDGGIAPQVTKQVTILGANQPPVLTPTAGNAAFTEGGAAAAVFAGTTVTDDGANLNNGFITLQIVANSEAADHLTITPNANVTLNGADVLVNGTTIGTLTTASDVTGAALLDLDLNANATPALVQTFLAAITFSNTSDNPSILPRTVRLIIDDGAGASDTADRDVDVTAVNDAPVIATAVSVAYTEGAAATVVDATATVTDVDSPNFDTGTLTVAVTAGGEATDALAIQNVGTAAGEIGVNGANVTFGGKTIGAFVGGDGLNPLVITFNANATPVAVQALVRNITFRSDSNAPPATKTITFTVTDGDTGTASDFTLVNITAVNDAPVVTTAISVAYTENAAAVVIDPTATVTDADSANFGGGSLTATVTAGGDAADFLEIRNEGTAAGQIGVANTDVTFGGTVIGTFAGGDGVNPLVVTLNVNATVTAVQALLRNITFRSTSDNPPAVKTVTFDFRDDQNALGSDFTTIDITATNDNPVITTAANAAYTEGAAAIVVDGAATVTDVDSDFNTGTLTVSISVGGETTDTIAIRNQGTAAGQVGVNGTNVTYEGTVVGTFTGGTNNTALVITFNAAATPTAVQAVARNITFQSASIAPPATKTMLFVVTDGDGGTAQDDTLITITATNDAPVITLSNEVVTYTEGGTAAIISATGTVTDTDSADFATGTLTVTITANSETTDVLAIRNEGTAAGQIGVNGTNVTFAGTTIGTFAGGTNGAALVITFNTNATPTAVTALVKNITFSSTSTNPSVAARTVQFDVTDGDTGSDVDSKTVNVTAVNSPPVQTLPGGNVAYQPNAAAVTIDAGATVTDPDSPNFDTGTLTVSLPTGGETTDILAIRNDGTAAGQIGVNGANVTFGGVTIGTFTGGTNNTALVITFNAAAVPTAVQALERAITFRSTASAPTATKTVRFVLTDGDGGTDTDEKTITTGNVAPVQTLPGGPTAYTENGAAVAIDAGATVTDADSADFAGGTLTVSIPQGNDTTDLLAIRNDGTAAGQIGVNGGNVTFGGTVIGTFTGGSGTTPLVITFNASATPAAVQVLERAIVYSTTSDNPPATKSVRFVLTDGDGGTDTDEKAINITAVNDAPVQTLSAETVTYSGTAIAISATGTVTDVDSANFDTGTLTISFQAGGTADDRLTINNEGTAANQIGVNGTNVTFGGTTIGTFIGGTNGTTPLVISFNTAATPSAVQALERAIRYSNVNATAAASTRTVRFVITDGDGGSDTDDKQLSVALANNAPVVTLSTETVSYTENGAAVTIAATSTITDANSSNFNTGVLTVSITANGTADDRIEIPNQGTGANQIGVSGSNVTFGGTVIGTFAGGTGTTPLTITLNTSATPAATQALLRVLTFRSVSENPSTAARTISVTLSDGSGLTSAAVTKSVAVVAVNDAPVNTVPGVQSTATGTAIVFNTANGNLISVSDVDVGTAEVQVTLTATNGTITLSGLTGLTFTAGDGTGDATMTFRGTLANVNAALAGLSFTPTANFTGDATITLTTSDQGATGTGGTLTDTDSVTVKVGSANVTGGVFVDSNNNGVRDTNEVGIPNVTITFAGIDANTNGITRTVTTGADGTYAISGLTPGQYRVTQTQPTNFLDGKTTPPTGGTVDANGVVVTVVAGQPLSGPNFGELGIVPAKITLLMFLSSSPSDQTFVNEVAPGGAKALNLAGGAVSGNSIWLPLSSAQQAVQSVVNNLLAAAGRVSAAPSSATTRTTSATNAANTWNFVTRPRTTTAAPQTLAQLQDALSNVEVRLADLPDGKLAETVGNVITFDVNAAGQGWFVDPTPNDNEEFFAQYGQLQAAAGSAAAGKVDLLSVAAHELGHVLGLDDLYDAADDADVMSDDLVPGVRKEIGDDLLKLLLGK